MDLDGLFGLPEAATEEGRMRLFERHHKVMVNYDPQELFVDHYKEEVACPPGSTTHVRGRGVTEIYRTPAPKEFAGCSLNDFRVGYKPKINLTKIDPQEEGVKPKPRNLLLFGNNGAGKSRLAAAICPVWLMTRWIRASELVKLTFNGRKEYVEIYEDTPRLVLDDITVVNKSDSTANILIDFLTKRAEAKKITVITTHATLQSIEDLWENPALTSRLKAFDVIKVFGPDRRAK